MVKNQQHAVVRGNNIRYCLKPAGIIYCFFFAWNALALCSVGSGRFSSTLRRAFILCFGFRGFHVLVASTLAAVDDGIDAFDLNTMSRNSFYSPNDMMNCSTFMEQKIWLAHVRVVRRFQYAIAVLPLVEERCGWAKKLEATIVSATLDRFR